MSDYTTNGKGPAGLRSIINKLEKENAELRTQVAALEEELSREEDWRDERL